MWGLTFEKKNPQSILFFPWLIHKFGSTLLLHFPSSLTLPWSEELRWDWIKCYTISPTEVRNLYLKQYQVDLQHCNWDGLIGVIGMIVLSLHFYNLCCMSYIQMILSLRSFMVSIPTIKDNMCFQLKPNVKVYNCCVHWDWGRQWAFLSHKIVIDIVKGTCETMDPYTNAQMDCIYVEVCNCKGCGAADIVWQMYLYTHLHLTPHRWYAGF
jgi:hypothetical protein